MTLAASTLSLVALGYLALLFLLAHLAERETIPRRFTGSPLVYSLSLGVYATSWTYFGGVGFAGSHGLTFLAVCLGPTLACIAAPLVWQPILRLSRDQQLTSLADLFAFRYRGRRVGVFVTLLALVASVPYIAQQIHAVVDSARALAPTASPAALGLGFSALLTTFTVLFGARHLTARERHGGLALAVAFESVVKLVALVAVGAAALFGVHGGVGGLEAYLATHPEVTERLAAPVREGTGYSSLILLSFGAAFLLPRQYHVAFAEGAEERSLRFAAVAFPVFLLLLNLPVLPILWAGQRLGLDASPDVYVLAVPAALGSTKLPLLAFLGGVSAASAMVIVTTIALAGMCVNYFVLPVRLDKLGEDPYRRLLWLRRALVAAIIFAGYGFYRVQERGGLLVETGLVSFVAFAQFLPGLLGVLFWKRATRAGFLSGLGAGSLVWVAAALLPLLSRTGVLPADLGARALFGADLGDSWTLPTVLSLSVNVALFGGVSLRGGQSPEEAEAARICAREAIVVGPPATPWGSASELEWTLARKVGAAVAEAEITRALGELGLSREGLGRADLRRLGDQVERNLSGLFGPILARLLVHPADRGEGDDAALADQLRFLDERLNRPALGLTGIAAELDLLRRYLRTVLDELPIGVCALGPRRDVILWNRALARTTGLAPEVASGLPLERLPDPFGPLLSSFADDAARAEADVDLDDGRRRLAVRLHKASLDAEGAGETGAPFGLVLLLEDRTERAALEAQLVHRDRLASVGRLAAGVAHEIGNPLTGITCLAQNLAEEPDAAEARARARLILEQAGRIDAIVRSLLGYSHAGASAVEPGPEGAFARVPLAPVVDQAIALVRLDRTGKRIQMENVCPDDLAVHADRQRLTQILINLLTNACDASQEEGSVFIDAARQDSSVVLRVIDAGTGIPEEVKARMFDPFFTTKPRGEGTGLGLAVVESIAREHGGAVWVESEEGVGTTVHVRLPLAPRLGEDAPSAFGGTT
ncbi:ATP-binding protein [Polyangium mundeleinium]|uniref:histidine kinase n=1 Tax=Polyangium mundeleinium TaxID=2995306 RepID=A0ABT5F444_9BACT|nr:ATP-binding protein [Polyangium mundeleinium]MDC0748858.1 ATP-binding protein [Polyangium mundeleinium]